MSWFEEAKRLAAATILVKEGIDPDIAEWRMSVCKTCEQFEPDGAKCRVCGCYLDIKTKCSVSRSPKRPFGEITHCPLGKWNDADIAAHYQAQDGKA